MLDDGLRIRSAEAGEADELSDIAWLSKEYWEYPVEMMKEFRDFLTVTEDSIEENPAYIVENEATGEIIGFYCLETPNNGGEWWLKHLWVIPEYIGTGVGGELFLHACEMAETVGAEELNIISDPNGEEFYLHMGAEKLRDEKFRVGKLDRILPVLCIKFNR